ncbi:branched-chain amino acid aminotransferase [Tabrizicola oligotrophica]|uniref:Probable branched-chain-amino-acid aminotransferase n=1 Tax=Tabrizicola oligotrophica TaxID=2710650 RepID=A0A6M0QT52_9RHOB|nr:branched-chain amino acid aminotransferase [Tabrizicola oligotrophica]NEY89833.1 branched-chain amino acid aminotransferase [Tabrizicola oligotrophica]
MASGTNIRTFFEGKWHEGNIPVMRAADHGAWLGSTVFDGARYFDGMAPDLDLHCARVNRSAEAMLLTPTMAAQEIEGIAREGFKLYDKNAALYVRPMYWGQEDDGYGLGPHRDYTGFALCLEEIPMSALDNTTTLTTTSFRRPVLADNVTNAKAGCLYPNNYRMIAEARRKGFQNALVADANGNVAETATANVFIVKDGVALTPIANGTFLAGLTRARHIKNLRADGVEVVEKVITFDEVRDADEVFLTGNFNKVSRVSQFDDVHYKSHATASRARALYWDWAASNR